MASTGKASARSQADAIALEKRVRELEEKVDFLGHCMHTVLHNEIGETPELKKLRIMGFLGREAG